MGKPQLGLQPGCCGAQLPVGIIAAEQEAKKPGLFAGFTAQVWASDCLTPLTWIAAHTSRVRLGTAICQMAARIRE